jgi:predicted HicB family RNase H-like nuclease
MAEPHHRTKTATINLRVDDDIKALAIRAAAADRRSLTAYIEKLIEDDVAERHRSLVNQVRAELRKGGRKQR